MLLQALVNLNTENHGKLCVTKIKNLVCLLHNEMQQEAFEIFFAFNGQARNI